MSEKDPVVDAAMRALQSAFEMEPTSLIPGAACRNDNSAPTPEHDSECRERARAVLWALPDLPGMSFWLQRERPAVWARCLKDFRRCDALWSAPLGAFDQALAEFDSTFRQASELYRLHLQKHRQGVLEGLHATKAEDEE